MATASVQIEIFLLTAIGFYCGRRGMLSPQTREQGTVKILAHFPTAPRPAPCGYSSSSVTSR